MATTVREDRLNAFTDWVSEHIRGDEKGEAQLFLDRLFQAFGQKGILEVGGKPEFRIRKAQEDGGGIAFADYVWKPVVLIEMKKRGTDLNKHYRQAFDYWVRAVPDRPRYVVLCNFDEFWVYDFQSAQLDTPVDKLAMSELSRRPGPLAFLFPMPERPVFGNSHEEVTRRAADCLATCFNKLMVRKVERLVAQRFILQMLVALFAEDIGLLEQYFVTRLLEDCKSPTDSYDLLGGLFAAMNTPGRTPGGRFKGVDYFNGGLFEEPAHLELHADELNQLRAAAKFDWSKVRPEIFGTLFEHSLDQKERHAFGAHFTAPIDIMKIVGPTIVDPWQHEIESAKTRERLTELLNRLQHFTVLDPACGSGNFLYVAYREMKRLEARLIERLKEFRTKADRGQRAFGFVTAQQFFGLDINPFAVELAKVTMMIARKFAIDEFHATELALPLDNLDENFINCDALLQSERWGADHPTWRRPFHQMVYERTPYRVKYFETQWPKADVIIGNPPFVGAKRIKPTFGRDYASALCRAFPGVGAMADFCVFWFRRAHDHLPACTEDDPVAGRAGLVGTQNIRNNQSRIGGLDHIVNSGTIIDAVETQPWSGEAAVHVSIVNWVKSQAPNLLPRKRKVWLKVEPSVTEKAGRKKQGGPSAKQFDLACREVTQISSTLSELIDVAGADKLRCNQEPHRVYNGQFPRHQGFVLTPSDAAELLHEDKRNREVVHPYLIGRAMLTDNQPDRWVIDFQKKSINASRRYKKPFAIVQKLVLPHVSAYAQKERTQTEKTTGQDQTWLKSWWQHFRCRQEMVDEIGKLSRYLACAEVTKRPIFCFVDPSIRPDHTIEAFLFDDDYSFGILQSNTHWQWFITKCSKLTERFRYTPESVFDTFPWPQSPTTKQINTVVKAGRELRRLRRSALKGLKGGLRSVYQTMELPGDNPLKDAHAELDSAVLEAYGFDPDFDLLQQLLELNHSVAARIASDETVTSPGIPAGYSHPERLISDDCVKPEPVA